jgi:hypothetical protein
MRRVLFLAVLGTATLWCGVSWGTASHSDMGCSLCHVPHHAGDPNDPKAFGVPLWNSQYSAAGLPTFVLYSSKSFDTLGTDIGQPDGASRMCLGCHDGSYQATGGSGSPRVFLAGDLARSHPVSFTYNSSLASKVPGGTLRDPSVATSGFGGTIARDLLDSQGKLQCDSCHDIHTTGLTANMLRWDVTVSSEVVRMCRTCHNR